MKPNLNLKLSIPVSEAEAVLEKELNGERDMLPLCLSYEFNLLDYKEGLYGQVDREKHEFWLSNMLGYNTFGALVMKGKTESNDTGCTVRGEFSFAPTFYIRAAIIALFWIIVNVFLFG